MIDDQLAKEKVARAMMVRFESAEEEEDQEYSSVVAERFS